MKMEGATPAGGLVGIDCVSYKYNYVLKLSISYRATRSEARKQHWKCDF